MYAEIYENQWKWPSGWRDVCYTRATVAAPIEESEGVSLTSKTKLVAIHLPIPSWSSVDGTEELHPVDMPAPAGCEWISDWCIQPRSIDRESQGWMYCPTFPELIASCKSTFHGARGEVKPITGECDAKWVHPVRRRRWVREYRPVDGALSADHDTTGLLPVRGLQLIAFDELVSEVTTYLHRALSLRKLIHAVGTERDSETLRSTIETRHTLLSSRMQPLRTCIEHNIKHHVGGKDTKWASLLTDCIRVQKVLETDWTLFRTRMRACPLPTAANELDSSSSSAINNVSGSGAGAMQVPPSSDAGAGLLVDAQLMLEDDAELVSYVVTERSENIQKVSSEVAEVSELFADLASLVVAQAPRLNKIEASVGSAHEAAQQGVAELKKAEEYQRDGACILM